MLHLWVEFALVGSDYKLESQINPKYQAQILKVNSQAVQTLKPINQKINNLSGVLEFLQTAQQNNTNFEATKTHIKNQNPEIYTELGLESKNSFSEIIFVIQTKKFTLEESKAHIITQVKNKLDALVFQNKNEAQEKDKLKQNLLEFLNSIGFDRIPQTKTNIIIDYINKYPGAFGLQGKIDFENADLGFNKDGGNKNINTEEKRLFIELFNQMLGGDFIDKNISKSTTTLSPEAIMKIQVLANKPVGFFMENLEIVKI